MLVQDQSKTMAFLEGGDGAGPAERIDTHISAVFLTGDRAFFRLYEAIGEPLPTRDLPLAFAWPDLRFVSGWKAQLEAAERLARAGSVGGNRMLGLYTERRATVSGAVWDRVRAVQALDLALNSGDPSAVSGALIDARSAMGLAGLEPALAQMMAHRLARVALKGPSRAMSSSRIWRRSSRRCAVIPSAPAASASLAARTGSGTAPPRALRTVAT